MEKNVVVRSLTELVESGKKVAFIAGNRQIDKKNKRLKNESFEKFRCNLVPLMYVPGEKAVSDGCSLVDATTYQPVADEEVVNYIVIVDGQHRYSAAMTMEQQPELFLFEDYTGFSTKELLAEANINATPWKADNFISGAALFQPNNELANFANSLAKEGYSTSTIGKILCLASGKLKKSTFADIMSGKDVNINEVDFERAKRFLAAARTKFSDKFIASRYLIDMVIELQSIKGADAVFDAIRQMSDDKAREIAEAKSTEKTVLLRNTLKAMIPKE